MTGLPQNILLKHRSPQDVFGCLGLVCFGGLVNGLIYAWITRLFHSFFRGGMGHPILITGDRAHLAVVFLEGTAKLPPGDFILGDEFFAPCQV